MKFERGVYLPHAKAVAGEVKTAQEQVTETKDGSVKKLSYEETLQAMEIFDRRGPQQRDRVTETDRFFESL